MLANAIAKAVWTDPKGPFTLSISDAVSVSVSDAEILAPVYYQWYRSHWLEKDGFLLRNLLRNGIPTHSLASTAIAKECIAIANAIAKAVWTNPKDSLVYT